MKPTNCRRCRADVPSNCLNVGHVYGATVLYRSSTDTRTVLPHVHVGDVLCEDCLDLHTLSEDEFAEQVEHAAIRYGIDRDDVLEDVEEYGLTHPLIQPYMAWSDSEPESCGICMFPFSDREEIFVLQLCDRVEGRFVPVDLEDGYNCIYICTHCHEMLYVQYL